MFKPVTSQPDFPALETKLLDWWYQSGVVKKYLAKNKAAKKKFFFLDGPITANNPMGVHHAWGRTYKDLWQRYKNMRGFRQRFQNGFDNQGLWVEVEVEKELGLKNKKEIEKFSIEKFVNKCKERTLKFAKVQTGQSKRLGYFMDWENSYYTMSDENNYMIWYFLKKCYQNGWLYKGRDTVPWCPRCGTAISQHEILTEEYQEITHKAITVEYKLKGTKDEYLLVWTTTPWTLPANVAIAVNPELEYVRFKTKTGTFYSTEAYMKKTAANAFDVISIKGADLIGKKYQGFFDHLPAVKKALAEKPEYEHKVIPWKDVLGEEGTGLVHIAPGAGEEDFDLGEEFNLPIVGPLDENGNYLQGYNEFSRKSATEVSRLVIDFFEKKDSAWMVEDYRHRYPVCWRCKTELLWRVVDEWYIAMDKTKSKVKSQKSKVKTLREMMMGVAKKIRWIPEFGLERELDWLGNMHDWLISKKRYWGLALPIWECPRGHFEVIGSREELRERTVEGWKKFEGHTPHRPWVDEVRIRCSKCDEIISRISDVGNPWLDAGIVSFSTLTDPKTGKVSYMTDKKYWQEWFPADFITENWHGQFKNWFYSLIAMSTVLENSSPYQTVLGHGLVRDEEGEEMHKSKGNAIDFDEAAEKMGVDVMRWMFCLENPKNNVNFGYNVADETRRQFHLRLWNVYKFFVTYANLDSWSVRQFRKAGRAIQAAGQPNILDRWILSRLNQTIRVVTERLDNYDAFAASHAIQDFAEDLSLWYIRRSRDRVGPTTRDEKSKQEFYNTMYQVIVTLAKLLAPFTPFIAEEIYKNLTNQQSVHLQDWPKAGKVDKQLLGNMALVRKVCELGHSLRKKEGIKVRQPLEKLKVKSEKLKVKKGLLDLIKDELNVKGVEFISGEREMEVVLDTKITSQLKAEGEARELVRKIQEARKKAGCKLDEKVVVELPAWPKEFEEYIKSKTLARELRRGKNLKISKS